MTVALCTLVLNEMQWLPHLYEQHKDWPGLLKWVFVESADRVYAETNPTLVSKDGLSVDGTTSFLEALVNQDPRVVHIKHGFSSATDPAQGKCQARSRYLEEVDSVKPSYLVVLDADEFYMRQFQTEIPQLMDRYPTRNAFIFRHREIWRPESLKDKSLFRYEVTGGFWDIPYCRCWRWFPGLSYSKNHNTPQMPNGILLDARMRRCDAYKTPFFLHMGFASRLLFRAAKNNYYIARGEGVNDRRLWYTESRAAWETWKLGDPLPRGAQVQFYDGPIPEAFSINTKEIHE